MPWNHTMIDVMRAAQSDFQKLFPVCPTFRKLNPYFLRLPRQHRSQILHGNLPTVRTCEVGAAGRSGIGGFETVRRTRGTTHVRCRGFIGRNMTRLPQITVP